MSKTVLITGASGGIGQAIAHAFGRAGYRMALHYHTNEAPVKALYGAYPNGNIYCADLAKEGEARAMVRAVAADFGQLDVVVNNAGKEHYGLFQETTMGDMQALFDVNFFGACHVLSEAVPLMVGEKRGCVINVSSIWGIVGASYESIYAASKAALIGLTKSLAKELAPSGIRVNCIAPGAIDTPMNGMLEESERTALEREIPLGRYGAPEEVGALARYLASDAAAYMTGQVLRMDGGFYM